MTKILVTGGSGWIAAHIVKKLLEQGHSVVATVRSTPKRDAILESYPEAVSEGRLAVVMVTDLTNRQEWDALWADDAVKGLEVVMHTASPFHFNWTDGVEALIKPAVQGTAAVMESLRDAAAAVPSVRRVIITSSWAAMLQQGKKATRLAHDGKTSYVSHPIYNETTWNPIEQADLEVDGVHPGDFYRASKTWAERAAWDFMEKHRGQLSWDLATVMPPSVLGPVLSAQGLGRDAQGRVVMNESAARFVAIMQGGWRAGIPPTPVCFWVDVRDVADAHIRAMEREQAGGKRLFVLAGLWSNAELWSRFSQLFPDLARGNAPSRKLVPDEKPTQMLRYDDSVTREVLGIPPKGGYLTLDQCIEDSVKSVQAMGDVAVHPKSSHAWE